MTDSRPSDCLTTHLDHGVARVVFDHGPMNLLDLELALALDAVSRELADDPGVRVIVFESAVPGYFLSHADVNVLQQMRDAGAYAQTGDLGFFQQVLERLRTMPKVTIAKVDGRARGGGAELVAAVDMAFASPTARFSQMEILLGILPGGGGAQYLAHKAGRSRTLELCLGGSDVSADDAVTYGYVNRVLPAPDLGPFVDRLARRIAGFPAEAIARTKANVLLAEDGLRPGLLDANAKFAALVAAPAFDRRVAAFLDAGGQTAGGELDDPARLAEHLQV